MTEEPKLRYELRRQSDQYATLWEGEHCLASICIKKSRGVLDAQLLLRVMNAHEDLLTACQDLLELADNGSAAFDDPEPGSPYLKAEAAIEKAQPGQEPAK